MNKLGPTLLCLAMLAPFLTAAAPVNLATNGTASGSSEGYGAVFRDAIDGNRNGNFPDGSVWHSQRETTRPPFLQIDLGKPFHLDHVRLFPRTDMRQESVVNFKLSVLNESGSEVWTKTYFPKNAINFAWGTADMRGRKGRFVRLERLDLNPPPFLTFAEFEVWGQTAAIPQNLALNKPVFASEAGFETKSENANDGNIDGVYRHYKHPIYHSAQSGVGIFWRVDLQRTYELSYLQIFNRVDTYSTAAPGVTTEAALSILDQNLNPVYFTNVVLTPTEQDRGANQYGIIVELPKGTSGSHVKLETTGDEFLVFGELEVFGNVGAKPGGRTGGEK